MTVVSVSGSVVVAGDDGFVYRTALCTPRLIRYCRRGVVCPRGLTKMTWRPWSDTRGTSSDKYDDNDEIASVCLSACGALRGDDRQRDERRRNPIDSVRGSTEGRTSDESFNFLARLRCCDL